MYNNHIMPQEDVGCECYSLAVMFHSFPVVRRKNTAVISKTHIPHTSLSMWKSGSHPLRWEEGENSNV